MFAFDIALPILVKTAADPYDVAIRRAQAEPASPAFRSY